jgi:hypothetical protein
MLKRLNYHLLHFLSCTLLGGVDLSRSASLFLISRRGAFVAQPPSSPPPPPPPPLLLAPLTLLDAALVLQGLHLLPARAARPTCLHLLLASKSGAAMARGGQSQEWIDDREGTKATWW